jgi:hypothetical protein
MRELQFSTADFVASEKPWNYMAQVGLTEPDASIPERELSALHDRFDGLDEVHLAFALAIAENFAPAMFAHEAAKLLGHPSLSVRVNAYRVICALPAESLSHEVRKAVAAGLSMCPERSAFANALARS